MTDTAYPQDVQLIRRGAVVDAPANPDAAPAAGSGGVADELKPYLPRMLAGAAIVLVLDLWWTLRRHRKERERERKRRRGRGRR